jgi:hypothetical protein
MLDCAILREGFDVCEALGPGLIRSSVKLNANEEGGFG